VGERGLGERAGAHPVDGLGDGAAVAGHRQQAVGIAQRPGRADRAHGPHGRRAIAVGELGDPRAPVPAADHDPRHDDD
jgi:hypothetical protein